MRVALSQRTAVLLVLAVLLSGCCRWVSGVDEPVRVDSSTAASSAKRSAADDAPQDWQEPAPDAVVPEPVDPTTPSEPVAAAGLLEVWFLDVDQGDSTLARLPDGRWMLVDAASGDEADTVVAHLKSRGITRIDVLIATHPHEDHIGGMDDVVRAFDVGEVYMPRVSHTTRAFESLLVSIADAGLTVRSARAGVVAAEGPGWSVTFLSPTGAGYRDINAWSAVVQVVDGSTSMLLTGDATKETESRLSGDIDVDLLRVAHHGSNSSSGATFLSRTTPTFAVISVGAGNDYGHPHGEVLDRLASVGARVYRTDRQGTIHAVSDGATITVTSAR